MPADRPPRGRRDRRSRGRIRGPGVLDDRRGRLDRLWGLVLGRFRDAAEAADNPDEERDDQT